MHEEFEVALENLRKASAAQAERARLRARSLAAWAAQPRPPLPPKLDASVKKTSGFLRRLRTAGLASSGLRQELEALNLSRYISEVVNALADARLNKSSDVDAIVDAAAQIHGRYGEFAPLVVPCLLRHFDAPSGVSGDWLAEDKEAASRVRSRLKLLTELFRAGIVRDVSPVFDVVRRLTREADDSCIRLSIVVGFCKYAAQDFTGRPSKSFLRNLLLVCGRSIDEGDEADDIKLQELKHTPELKEFSSLFESPVDAKSRKEFYTLIESYFQRLSLKHKSLRRDLRKQRKANKRVEIYRGSVDEKHTARLSDLEDRCTTLARPLEQLAELLSFDWLVDEEVSDEEDQAEESARIVAIPSGDGGIFEDEETRAFYEVLPDLTEMVPAVLLQPDKLSMSPMVNDDGSNELNELTDDHEEDEKFEFPSKDLATKGTLSDFDIYLQELSSARSRTCADDLAERFCRFNNRASRRRLVQTIYGVPRNRLDLLPFYARLIAVLNRCISELGETLVQRLRSQFFGLHHNNSKLIDVRIKNVRFIGELVMFRVAHPSVAFDCWSALLDSFSPSNIAVLSSLLESCGRWLARAPETAARADEQLKRMMQLKSKRYLEEHLETMIDNAYYTCKPPARVPRREIPLSPMQKYLRRLILYELAPSNVDYVLQRIRRFDWSDELTRQDICARLCAPHTARAASLPLLATIVSGLLKYHPMEMIGVVDCVFEEVRAALEANLDCEMQRRISFISYVGHMYNQGLIEAQQIFDTLYLLITASPSRDSPSDSTRLSLIGELLSVSGHDFSLRVRDRRRLERFYVYLQRYQLSKHAIRADVEFYLDDLFDSLCPQAKRYSSAEQVQQRIDELEGAGSKHRDKLFQLSQFPEESVAAAESDDSRVDDDDEDDEDATSQDGVEDEARAVDEDDEEEEVWDRRRGRNSADPLIAEDRSFLDSFDKLMLESVEERRREKKSVQNLTDADTIAYAAAAAATKAGQRIKPARTSMFESDEDQFDEEEDEAEEHIVFRVLTRKNNKPLERALPVPADSRLAVASSTRDHRERQREEHEAIRRAVVAGIRREEEAEHRDTYADVDIDLSYRRYGGRDGLPIELQEQSNASRRVRGGSSSGGRSRGRGRR